jgi:hypothetical protein
LGKVVLLRIASAMLALSFPLAGMSVAAASAPTGILAGLSVFPTENPAADTGVPLDVGAAPLPMLAQGEPVLPLWTSPDGRLLTIVALSEPLGAPVLPLAPNYDAASQWGMMDTSALLGGLRWNFGRGFHADTLIGDTLAHPVICAEAGCAVDDAGSVSFTEGVFDGRIGLGWTSPGGDVDLSYGLSWLQSGTPGRALPLTNASGAALPVLALPGLAPYQLQSGNAMSAHGTWHLGGPTLDFGASYGEGRFLSFGEAGSLMPGLDLNQTTLSLGVGTGSIRGVIVGHLLSGETPLLAGKRWTTLDLGVSWRTPWQGVLSVGAQNLWASPAEPTAHDADPAQARMPYIQYRQDL